MDVLFWIVGLLIWLAVVLVLLRLIGFNRLDGDDLPAAEAARRQAQTGHSRRPSFAGSRTAVLRRKSAISPSRRPSGR